MKKQVLTFFYLSGVLMITFLSACTRNSENITKQIEKEITNNSTPTEDTIMNQEPHAKNLRAGLRSSRYGIEPFPSPQWWLDSTQSMADSFEGADPAVVWIVGVVDEEVKCRLNFPAPDDQQLPNYENILFTDYEMNEDYLTLFDQNGVKVWLQVEPSQADVEVLIDLVLNRYGSHPSVIGFGVDVEWYKYDKYLEGKVVTDEEASDWVNEVRSHNSDYLLFVKHWLPEKMPRTYREGMMFLDDSQQFNSVEQILSEFKVWGEHFSPAPVGFQYGYPADRFWWEKLDNPPVDLGKTLLENIPNTSDLYWVDFTAREIWKSE